MSGRQGPPQLLLEASCRQSSIERTMILFKESCIQPCLLSQYVHAFSVRFLRRPFILALFLGQIL